MRRADRLFQLIVLLGRRRRVTGEQLAESLGVSRRTVYRGIRDLTLSGVPIDGEAGVGFRPRSGYFGSTESVSLCSRRSDSGMNPDEAWRIFWRPRTGSVREGRINAVASAASPAIGLNNLFQASKVSFCILIPPNS